MSIRNWSLKEKIALAIWAGCLPITVGLVLKDTYLEQRTDQSNRVVHTQKKTFTSATASTGVPFDPRRPMAVSLAASKPTATCHKAQGGWEYSDDEIGYIFASEKDWCESTIRQTRKLKQEAAAERRKAWLKDLGRPKPFTPNPHNIWL